MIVLKKDFDKLVKEVSNIKNQVDIINEALGIYKKYNGGRPLGWMFRQSMFEEHGCKEIDMLNDAIKLIVDHFGLEYVKEGKIPAKLVKKTKKRKAVSKDGV